MPNIGYECNPTINGERMKENGIFGRRTRLYKYITSGLLNEDVINELLPEGKPHEYEKQLWDYKKKLPSLPEGYKPNRTTLSEYNFKISEIIKDAVSFYNSYGGYLLIGVSDSPREIVGFDSMFDCDELNKRIKAETGHDIDCHYKTHKIKQSEKEFNIGLLFIPKRKDGVTPAQFKKNSPDNGNGKYAFRKEDIYFRDGSECKPAVNADDFSFLCAQGCRRLSYSDSDYECKFLDNNLGAKDPGFIQFVGREEYLTILWKWLFDKYMPAKLLTGLGGVGKTTLAREFVEEIIRSAPVLYERVVWLSAKEQFYTAIQGEFKPTTRVDFYDLNSLLISILQEIGWPEDQIDHEWIREDLLDKTIESLSEIPILLIIDDIDSLDLSEQHDVFQAIALIFGQTIRGAKIPSKALMTARLDLGAAPGQFLTVKGLNHEEFVKYIKMTSKSIELEFKLGPNSKLMKNFHKVTDGSPTFASSILRLLSIGEKLKTVLDEWQGSAGKEVRDFAFKKELKNLTDSQLRTLYAGCILGETSLLELKKITISNDTLLKDDISELKQYHLVSLGGELPAGGARLIVPNSIRLMTNLIKEKILDPRRIEKECAKIRAGTPKLEDEVGMVVYRVIALWKSFEYDEALEVARWGNKKIKKNADIKCLLGRAYMNIDPPNARQADSMFRRSFELDCNRAELFELWVNAKLLLKDWVGIIDITKLAKENIGKDIYFHIRVEAYGMAAEAAQASSNLSRASEYYFNGAREIIQIENEISYSARKGELLDFKEKYAHYYIKTIDQINDTSRDYIETWLAIWKLYKLNFISVELIEFGLDRLSMWWNLSVLERKRYSQKTKKLFEIQIDRFSDIVDKLGKKKLVYGDWYIKGQEQLDKYKKMLEEYVDNPSNNSSLKR